MSRRDVVVVVTDVFVVLFVWNLFVIVVFVNFHNGHIAVIDVVVEAVVDNAVLSSSLSCSDRYSVVKVYRLIEVFGLSPSLIACLAELF